MHFILTGFTQDSGFRVFAFEGISAERVRTSHTVRTDLGLIQRYAIRIQELPLLCRSLLERHEAAGDAGPLTFTEEDMVLHARDCAAARLTASQRKSPRKPASQNLGSAWRGPQPQ